MFHSIIFNLKLSDICLANSVLPVPGSPLINKGFSSAIAAFTAIFKSSVDI